MNEEVLANGSWFPGLSELVKLKLSKILASLSLAFVASGCAIVGPELPEPHHSEMVEIDPDLTNHQITERLLTIFADHGVAPCGKRPPNGENLPKCFVSSWQGTLTKVDQDEAIVEIGRFSADSRTVGHKARVWRSSVNSLWVTVKGVGPYYSDLPNEDVSRKLAKLVSENL